MNIDFFSWSTNVWIVGGVFAFLLLSFHYLLVWRSNLEDIQWKRVDYIWVGLSTFAILIYIADFRKYADKIDFQYKDNNWRSMIPIVASSFTWMEGYLCHPKFIITENTPKDWQDTDKKFQEACNFVTQTLKTIKTELASPDLT